MQRFELGRPVATPGALRQMEAASVDPIDVVARHARLEQGSLSNDDHAANQRAVIDGTRVLSALEYGARRVWVITEADRSSTCVLLPEQY
jgi:hypothetical protein